MKIRKIAGGFTTAKGFKAASCEAAIKYHCGKDIEVEIGAFDDIVSADEDAARGE